MAEPEELAALVSHYYARWRDTDKLMEQKMTAWLASCTAIVAAVALGDRLTDADRNMLWSLGAIVSFGVAIRLVRAKHSIIRSIRIMNRVRLEQEKYSPHGIKSLRATLLNADVTPPPLFSWVATPSAAALVGAIFTHLALGETGHLTQVWRNLLAGFTYGMFALFYWKKSQQMAERLTSSGL